MPMAITDQETCVCRDCKEPCSNDPFFCERHNHFARDEKRIIVTSRFEREYQDIVRQKTGIQDFRFFRFHHSFNNKQQDNSEVQHK